MKVKLNIWPEGKGKKEKEDWWEDKHFETEVCERKKKEG